MAGPAESPATATSKGELRLPKGGGRVFARRVLGWSAGFALALAGLGLAPELASSPEWPLAAALGLGLVGSGRPLIGLIGAASALAAGAFGSLLGLPPVLITGTALGLVAVRMFRADRDGLDYLNGALAGTAGAALALTTLQLATGIPEGVQAVLAGLAGSVTLLPAVLRWRGVADVPSRRQVKLTLELRYRAPVLRALDLHAQLQASRNESELARGLGEVVGWVYRLAQSIQTFDQELSSIDEEDLSDRIELLLLEAEETTDEFTRDRRLATARHLKQLVRHTDQIRLERDRLMSLQDYALAYLEEARLGLALARTLPGESTPDRLDEVLDRLRAHALDGDVRRQTAREVQGLA